MACAVYMPVGPGDDEIARAADVVDSAAAYCRSLQWVVLVDDARERRQIEARVRRPAHCELVVLHNPRDGAGNGRNGGMCVSTLIALDWIHASTDAHIVLKLDTDSLVIAPFEERIDRAIEAFPDVGMFGVIGDSAAPDRTYHFMEHNWRLFEMALRVKGNWSAYSPKFREEKLQAWGVASEEQFQSFLYAREVLECAVSRGYRAGEYCQGGGYVVTRRLMEAMAEAARWADPMQWCPLEIAEDVMMGLQCAAAGLTMRDLSGLAGVFTVEGPLPFSPQELASSGTSVIHSIKGDREGEFRQFFHARRNQTLQAVS